MNKSNLVKRFKNCLEKLSDLKASYQSTNWFIQIIKMLQC